MDNRYVFCGNDKIDVAWVSTATIEVVTGHELKQMQREHLAAVINNTNSAVYKQKMETRIQYALDTYKSDIEAELWRCEAGGSMQRGSLGSSFKLGDLDPYGNGTVEWREAERSFDVASYIIPLFERLYQKQDCYEWAMYFLSKGNLQKDLYDICNDYKSAYSELQRMKRVIDTESSDEVALAIYFVNGTVKKYLGRYVGFDINSKKVEINDYACAYRNGRQMRFNVTKTYWYHEVHNHLKEAALLSKTQLSCAGKRTEYAKLRRFCSKYIPKITEREWNIWSLCQMYPYQFDRTSCMIFNKNWKRINRAYFTLSKGARGESKVGATLACIGGDRIRVLENFVWGCEHDFIVIAPQGIFTIEVKNVEGDCVLSETGYLNWADNGKGMPIDVVWQSLKHRETLQNQLKDCSVFSETMPPQVEQILCFAESPNPVEDRYHDVAIAYPTTLKKALKLDMAEPFTEEGRIFTEEEMDEIERYLLDHQCEECRFNVFGPRGEIDDRDLFFHAFADIVSTYKAIEADCASYHCS